jgi:intracellular septation protein
MKALFDLFPLLVFFGAYATVDIFFATAAMMVATTLQVAWAWFKHRKIEKMLMISFCAIIVFGSMTLLLHDKRFIMIKPTIVYWIMAGALLISFFWFKKNPIRAMMEKHFDAPDAVWNQWLYIWASFFGAMGVLNLLVAYSFSEDIWVKFKVFGTLAMSLALAFLQGWRLMRYARPEITGNPPQ